MFTVVKLALGNMPFRTRVLGRSRPHRGSSTCEEITHQQHRENKQQRQGIDGILGCSLPATATTTTRFAGANTRHKLSNMYHIPTATEPPPRNGHQPPEPVGIVVSKPRTTKTFCFKMRSGMKTENPPHAVFWGLGGAQVPHLPRRIQ